MYLGKGYMQTLIMKKKKITNPIQSIKWELQKQRSLDSTSRSHAVFFGGRGLPFVFLLFFALKTKHLNLEKLPVRKVLFKSFLNIHLAEGRWVRDGILLLQSSCQGLQKKKKKPWKTGAVCAGTRCSQSRFW